VVLGGHHPTACPEDVLRHGAVDFIIRGEGEVAMPLLAKALKDRTPIKDLPGIGYKTGLEQFHINPTVYMERPDDFPLPADHLINHRYYRRKTGRSIVVTAGRGCPMRCSYCCVGSTSEVPYRKRSVAAVVGEITRAMRGQNAGFVDFEDENLSMDRAWFLDLLGEIKTRFKTAVPELRAMNGLYPPSLDEKTVAAMKAAGFSTLNLSLCSTDAVQLNRFLRPDVTRAFSDALGWAEKYGLDAVGYIIAGAPHQTAASSLQDLLFLAGKRVLAGLSIYYPAPGSRDYSVCRELGVLPDDYALMRSSALPVSHTTRRIESVTLLRLSRILNFMKGIIDRGEKIPDPAPFIKGDVLPGNSGDMGRALLSWFLYDGKIRGVTREGAVYEHRISEKPARDFIDGIKTVRLRGCRT